MSVLVAYASAYGSTAEIAQYIGGVLEDRGYNVSVQNVNNIQNITPYNQFILGSAVHHGLWLREMTGFVQRHRDILYHKSVYVWLTCMRVLEEDGYDHVLNHYFRPELMRNVPVKGITAFAGRLDLKEIDWSQRWTLGLQYDGAKTPENLRGDYRDWKAISTWVQQITTEFDI